MPIFFADLLLIGFDKTHLEDQNHLDRMVHLFLYDYRFERIREDPKYGHALSASTVRRRRGGGVTAGATKTGAGKRVITLPPDMAYNRMKTLLKRARLPELRFHDLRHTFATHALASGVDAKTLSGILGHTKASFTLDTYAHVTPDMMREAVDTMGDVIGKAM